VRKKENFFAQKGVFVSGLLVYARAKHGCSFKGEGHDKDEKK
jgi:hypothetical protein